jgi:NitT/TauT family transport system ATP-binding protein
MKLLIRDVSKVFVSEKGEQVEALSHIDLEVDDQEFICILGPSGCGKTTLLRIIAGLDDASSGGVETVRDGAGGPVPKTAMIFQEYSLYPWRSVLDNIAFGLELGGASREAMDEAAHRYVELVGLRGFEQSYPYELSGGMRQRVAVARALAIEPDVLLMDEPFGALDAQTRNRLQKEILEIWDKTRKTILFVTHSVDEAVYLADRIVVLTGRPGSVREVISVGLPRPRDRTSVEFAGIRRHVLDMMNESTLPVR